MPPSGNPAIAVRRNGKLTQFPLFQPVSMRSVNFTELLDDLRLLKYAMFREGHGDWKITVTARRDVSIPGGQSNVGVDGVVNGRPDQKLLPLSGHVMPAPLPFQMKTPFGIADRVIAKIIPPAVSVIKMHAGLRRKRCYGTEKEENFHDFVMDANYACRRRLRATCPLKQ